MTVTPPGKPPGEAVLTRLLWREQLRELPRAAWHALRRLLRREPRWYYVIDGRVIARLVADQDRDSLMEWIASVHGQTFLAGQQFGRAVSDAIHSNKQADPGDPGTP